MVVTFDKEYLKELYEFGKANDKKHRFQPDIVRRYKRCIDIIISVPDVTSLCKYNGLSFEKLSGDKKDFCSVRVNNQYRIEFTTTEVQGEVVTTICNMIKIDGVDPKMIANNLIPFEPTHPGEVLKDEIEFRGISQKKLAKEMGVSYTVLNEILNAKRSLNTKYAMLLEAALDLDAEPLLKMQTSYNLQMAKKDNRFMERINKVRKIAALL